LLACAQRRAVKNVGGRGTVSYRDAVEIAAGDPASILNPTPIFFTACWGAFFYSPPQLPQKPENPAPPIAQNIAYSIRHSPLSAYPRVCIRSFFNSSSSLWVFVFLRLISVFRFFRPGFRSSSFCLCPLSPFVLSNNTQNDSLFYFPSNPSIRK